MSRRIVKTLVSDDGEHRLHISEEQGRFRANEETRATTYDGEPCWTPEWPSAVDGMIADSAEAAEAEARARIAWLSDRLGA
jgi:hypothetical protein